MPAGRPPIYTNPDDMQDKIDLYFMKCETKKKPATVPGLAYFLGFADKTSLWDYTQKLEFTHTILRAKTRIEIERAEKVVDPELRNARGIMFDLSANFNWKEKTAIEHEGLPIPPSTLSVVMISAAQHEENLDREKNPQRYDQPHVVE